VYEPELKQNNFFNSRIETDLKSFKQVAEIVVANPKVDKLWDVDEKVFIRDLFGEDKK
jgi:UDPglucose 6-dehydrogenase